MYNPQNTADIIKNLLISKHKSAKEFCKECNLGINTISNIRKGDIKNIEHFITIADYFGISLDYLLGRVQSPQNVNTGDITNNSGIIGQTNAPVTINGKERILTTQEHDLLRIYNAADGKTQMKIMNYVYDIEENL